MADDGQLSTQQSARRKRRLKVERALEELADVENKVAVVAAAAPPLLAEVRRIRKNMEDALNGDTVGHD